jgi:shikimate dehydrogenase
MENIILIGMPGCGKSTVGKLLAEKCGKDFADADALIEELAGKPIPQIFAEDGEEVFREWETKALTELSKQSGLVIATGGGCVTKARNYPLLRQNGCLVWLQRSTEELATEGRPLSQGTNLSEMCRIRQPLYRQFADITIENSGTPEDTAAAILKKWEEAL